MEISCNVCENYLTGHIYVCKAHIEHMICDNCVTKIGTVCSKCTDGTKLSRNETIEKLIQQSKHNCIYGYDGCAFSINIAEKSKHEKYECFYRSIKCDEQLEHYYPNWQCDWTGKAICFYKHFQKRHPQNVYKYISDNNRLIMDLSVVLENRQCYLISAYNKLFWWKCYFDDASQNFYWYIQCICSPDNASRYYFEFDLIDTKDKGRHYKFTETCRSALESHTELINSENCVSIQLSKLRSFCDQDESTFRFRIGKKNLETNQSKESESNEKNEREDTPTVHERIKTSYGSSPIASALDASKELPPLNLPSTVRYTGRSRSATKKRTK